MNVGKMNWMLFIRVGKTEPHKKKVWFTNEYAPVNIYERFICLPLRFASNCSSFLPFPRRRSATTPTYTLQMHRNMLTTAEKSGISFDKQNRLTFPVYLIYHSTWSNALSRLWELIAIFSLNFLEFQLLTITKNSCFELDFWASFSASGK